MKTNGKKRQKKTGRALKSMIPHKPTTKRGKESTESNDKPTTQK